MDILTAKRTTANKMRHFATCQTLREHCTTCTKKGMPEAISFRFMKNFAQIAVKILIFPKDTV